MPLRPSALSSHFVPPLRGRQVLLKEGVLFLPQCALWASPDPNKASEEALLSARVLLLGSYSDEIVVPVGDSTCASGAHPRTNFGAGCRYPFATRQNRTVEQIVDVSILQIQEETSEFASFGMHSTWHRFCVLTTPVPKCFILSSSSSHPHACNAVGTSDGVIPLSRNCVRSQFFRFFPIPRFFGFFQLGKVQKLPASRSPSELSAHQMGVRKVFGGHPFYLAGAKDQSVSSTNGRSSCRTRTSFKLHFSVAPTL